MDNDLSTILLAKMVQKYKALVDEQISKRMEAESMADMYRELLELKEKEKNDSKMEILPSENEVK